MLTTPTEFKLNPDFIKLSLPIICIVTSKTPSPPLETSFQLKTNLVYYDFIGNADPRPVMGDTLFHSLIMMTSNLPRQRRSLTTQTVQNRRFTLNPDCPIHVVTPKNQRINITDIMQCHSSDIAITLDALVDFLTLLFETSGIIMLHMTCEQSLKLGVVMTTGYYPPIEIKSLKVNLSEPTPEYTITTATQTVAVPHNFVTSFFIQAASLENLIINGDYFNDDVIELMTAWNWRSLTLFCLSSNNLEYIAAVEGLCDLSLQYIDIDSQAIMCILFTLAKLPTIETLTMIGLPSSQLNTIRSFIEAAFTPRGIRLFPTAGHNTEISELKNPRLDLVTAIWRKSWHAPGPELFSTIKQFWESVLELELSDSGDLTTGAAPP